MLKGIVPRYKGYFVTAPIRLKSGSQNAIGPRKAQVLELEGLQLAEEGKRSIRRTDESRLCQSSNVYV